MDYITIKNLEVFSKHGVFAEENRLGQKFTINAKLFLDTRDIGILDDIDRAVNYADVCHFINAFMRGHTFNLIETVAERLASDLLLQYPAIDHVKLDIKKPWAPIGLPIEEVSVTIVRGWHDVYLSLGSNIEDRQKYLMDAILAMEGNDDIRVIKQSDIIETKAYGNEKLDDFLNCAVHIKTLMTPNEMLEFIGYIEKEAGRIRTEERWSARPLDADILFYDDCIIDSEKLTIPHYDIKNRFFVLEPMCQIAPYLRHPIENKTMIQLLEELKEKEDNK